MPAKTEKQRKFMGAELERKREGKQTRTGMSESELENLATKPGPQGEELTGGPGSRRGLARRIFALSSAFA